MEKSTRRSFFRRTVAGTGLASATCIAAAADNAIQGFDETSTHTQEDVEWTPVSDRKVRVGIVGYGVCRFGAAFGFQDHPNVEIGAVSDQIPERCQALAKACRCEKMYPSLEELVKDDTLDAVFVATDAPSHARHCMDVLAHGKHVATAVPAVFGSLEDAEKLYAAVKQSGLKYMMFETSVFRDDCYAMRALYNADALGKLTYAEGEYYHYMSEPIDSFKGWRIGLPPQWYPTHSNAYFTGVTGGGFTRVSCMAMPSVVGHLKPENNRYENAFGTETALFRTTEGGSARMAVSWDTPGHGGEVGRVRGQKGSVYGTAYAGVADISGITLAKPPLPPGMSAGGHGGSHGYLCEEFITAILEDRKPLVDIAWALNMTVAGVVAHQSALRDGELLDIPVYTF